MAGVALVRELPATRKTIALCGQEIISGSAEAGDDFWLVAFARTENPTGTLNVTWDAGPSTVALSVDSLTADGATGTVTATGTYTCSADPLDFGMLALDLWPGTKKMESGELEITECSGEPTPFTLEVTVEPRPPLGPRRRERRGVRLRRPRLRHRGGQRQAQAIAVMPAAS